MEKQYFQLDGVETNRFINWVRLVFGALCIAVAAGWLFLYPESVKSGITFWISLLFLIGFGLYQINSGMERGRRFIVMENKNIIIKRNSLLPAKTIKSEELEKIFIMPLNIKFVLINKKLIILRMGTTYIDIIKPIQDAVFEFAEKEKIPIEIVSNEI